MARKPRIPKYRVTIEFCDNDEESLEHYMRAVKVILDKPKELSNTSPSK